MFLQEQLKGIIIIEDFAHVSFGKACVVHVRCGKLHVISGACVHRLMQNRDTCNLFFQCKLSTSHVSSKYLLTCFQSVSSERCFAGRPHRAYRRVPFLHLKRQTSSDLFGRPISCCHRKLLSSEISYPFSARVSARSSMSSRECVVYWYSI